MWNRNQIPAREFEEAKARAAERRSRLEGGQSAMSAGMRRILVWVLTAGLIAVMTYGVWGFLGPVPAAIFLVIVLVATVGLWRLWR